MHLNKINLTPIDIWTQNFNKVQRGYHCYQVDEFLDLIIKDYQSFEKQIEDLMKENSILRRQIAEKTKKENDKPNTIDILQRLSKLERRVFFEKITSS